MLQSQIQVPTLYQALQSQLRLDRSASKPVALQNPLDLLDARGIHFSVKRGRVIYTEGETADYCYKLVSGNVRTVKLLSDGRRQVCEFLMPGDHLGFGSQGEYYFTAEAVSDAELVRYSRKSVEALIREDTAVAQRLRQLASHDLQGAYERMVLLCHKSAQQRVAWFLLNMAERSGTDEDDFVLLSMTRTDIADYLGMALETVSRAIGQLKHKGIIALENVNRILFLDRDMLEQSRGEV